MDNLQDAFIVMEVDLFYEVSVLSLDRKSVV